MKDEDLQVEEIEIYTSIPPEEVVKRCFGFIINQ